MDNKNHENIDENNEENNINENENGEDFEEDIYLMQLHKRFIEMKKDRKKAEQDANLLGNRLKLLKGEEEKTWKKIENTRKKTQEKVSNLQKLEEELRKFDLLVSSQQEIDAWWTRRQFLQFMNPIIPLVLSWST